MICVMKVKRFRTRFVNNHIKSSNFAESFLVVEDLASISIHFGKLLTVTRFLITRTSNC